MGTCDTVEDGRSLGEDTEYDQGDQEAKGTVEIAGRYGQFV